MKLIYDNLANINIFPDKNLVVTFTWWSFFLIGNDLIDAKSSGQKSTIIFVVFDFRNFQRFFQFHKNFFFQSFFCVQAEFIESKSTSLLLSKEYFLAAYVGSFLSRAKISWFYFSLTSSFIKFILKKSRYFSLSNMLSNCLMQAISLISS